MSGPAIRTVELVAYYSGQAGLGISSSGDAAADKAQSQITRVETKQKVLITTKDGQSASGDWAIFDTKANTVLLGDNVTITRGRDVAQGSRLGVNSTPTVYINGRVVSGAHPYETFATIIDEELSRSK